MPIPPVVGLPLDIKCRCRHIIYENTHTLVTKVWNLIVGQLVSTAIALVTIQLLGSSVFSRAVAMGLAIAAMMMTDSVHPPGGTSTHIYVAHVYPLSSYLMHPPLRLHNDPRQYNRDPLFKYAHRCIGILRSARSASGGQCGGPNDDGSLVLDLS